MDDWEEDGGEWSDANDDEDDDGDSSVSSEEIEDEIVEKFIRTFNNGDYDTEFDDTLSWDRGGVIPTAWSTQASYNKPDN
jgi:hypothetical protein